MTSKLGQKAILTIDDDKNLSQSLTKRELLGFVSRVRTPWKSKTEIQVAERLKSLRHFFARASLETRICVCYCTHELLAPVSSGHDVREVFGKESPRYLASVEEKFHPGLSDTIPRHSGFHQALVATCKVIESLI